MRPEYVAFPLSTRATGGTASVGYAAHVQQLVEQVLFTSPGERVNRPTFGCGLEDLVFGTLSEELVAATRFVVRANLQSWLRDEIRVDDVTVTTNGGELTVAVTYALLATGEAQTAVFQR